jgi:hypothetical protein
MRREAGSDERETTRQRACRAFTRGRAALPAGAATRDSTRKRQAKAMFTTVSAAAASPGASGPSFAAKEAIAGPMATPAFVAAESQPRLFARFFGSVASAT